MHRGMDLPGASGPEDDALLLARADALHSALASIPGISVVVFDRGGSIRALHGEALARHGYAHADVFGRRAGDVLPARVWQRLEPLVARALAGETLTIRQRSDDGMADYESTLGPYRHGGTVIGATMASRDITCQVAAERALSQANERLQAILDHSPMAIFMRDLESRWVLVNAETCRLVGRPAAELLGHRLSEAFPDEVVERLRANDRTVLAAGEPQSFDELVDDARTGTRRTMWTIKFPVRNAQGFVAGIGGVALDVTDRERSARELRAARDLAETMFSCAPVGMLVSELQADGTARVVRCNPAFAAMLGRDAAELVGAAGDEIVHPDDLAIRAGLLREAMAGRAGAQAEIRFVHRDGHAVWALVAPTLTRGPDDELLVVLQAIDVSERKTFEERLRHLADRDALTGLSSRRRFEEELQREVSRVRRHRRPGAVLLLDLDGFKAVNDTFGHAAGDELLVRVADALRTDLRDSDVLARMDGDEFALIVPDADEAAVRVVAEKLRRVVARNGSVMRGDRRVDVRCSIGIAPLDGRRGATAARLLVEADMALRQAKAAGKDAVHVHAPPPAEPRVA
jgi:diguanylate cyclase (GGDEF)-like protein/PAS domain S-box-containing protein